MALVDPGVVDQDVEPGFGEHVLHHVLDLVGAGEVGVHRLVVLAVVAGGGARLVGGLEGFSASAGRLE